MRIAIMGSRDYGDCYLVEEFTRQLPTGTQVISGSGRGVNGRAEDTARASSRLPKPIVFPLPRSVGDSPKAFQDACTIRNAKVIGASDLIFVFWDGQSADCKYLIIEATKAGKMCIVVPNGTTLEWLNSLVVLDDHDLTKASK